MPMLPDECSRPVVARGNYTVTMSSVSPRAFIALLEQTLDKADIRIDNFTQLESAANYATALREGGSPAVADALCSVVDLVCRCRRLFWSTAAD